MVFNKYKYRRYDKRAPNLFQKERRRLSNIFPAETKIEHVGSTAIPGLGGKGMIDIAIAVPKSKMPYYIKKLEKIGFQYKPKSKDNQRKYLERKIIYRGKERRVHLHLTYETSQMWKSFIAVRNYLRSNKDAQQKYIEIKKQALKKARGNGKKYHKYKHKFIEYLSKKGLSKK